MKAWGKVPVAEGNAGGSWSKPDCTRARFTRGLLKLGKVLYPRFCDWMPVPNCA